MELVYSCDPKLPALAWLAKVKGDKVEVLHGENVETHERFFVEGAWGGYFQLAALILLNGSAAQGRSFVETR